MDLLNAGLDILFLLLAIAIFRLPGAVSHTQDTHLTSPPPASPYLSLPGHSGHSTPSGSPLPSPVGVPVITITPDRPQIGHKRKSVSFSLSSMGELKPDEGVRKRPPTPFVSKNNKVEEESPGHNMPGTPLSALDCSREVMDPMGVQKGWLLG